MASTAPRDGLPDLLVRPPCGTREFVQEWAHLIIDPIQQLRALAELYELGLLSWSEYESHKRALRI